MITPSMPIDGRLAVKALALGLTALLVVSQLAGCSAWSANSPEQLSSEPSVTPVRVASPERGSIASSLSFTGDVRARSQVSIVAAAPGRIEKLLVDVGSQVNAGDIIVEQDHSILDAQVRQAEGNLAAAKARLASMREGSRAETIAQAQANLDIAKQRLETLKQGPRAETVAQAQANLDAAEAQLAALEAGPTPQQIEVAETQVRLAKNQLFSVQTQADAYLGSRAAAMGQLVFTSAMKEAQSGAAYEQVKLAEAQLAALTAPPTPEQLKQAQAAVDAAAAQLQLATKPYTDQDIAQAEDAVIVAEQQLKLAENPYTQHDLEAAEAQVAIAEANLDLAKAQANQMVITAPITGVVSERYLSEGAQAGPTTPILTIVGSDVDIFIPVEQHQVWQVAVGQTVSCSIASQPDMRFAGVIASVSPAGDPLSRSFKAKVTPEDPEHQLKPGMFVQVEVTVGQKDSALLVPKAAIVERNGETQVFVVKDGVAVLTKVTTGFSDGARVEIIEGLDGSEQVIVAGHANLGDNDRVSVEPT